MPGLFALLNKKGLNVQPKQTVEKVEEMNLNKDDIKENEGPPQTIIGQKIAEVF